jgi:diaminopimelate epimerase
MKMEFTKFSGAKNLFLIAKKTELSTINLEKLVKTLCDPYEGFFADGIVFVENISGTEFKWYFYNSDGSSAEMCGNAARCAHSFIKSNFPGAMDSISLQTLSGKIYSKFKEGFFHVQMTPPKSKTDINLDAKFFDSGLDFETFKDIADPQALFVDTGVPHLVITISNWEKAMRQLPMWLFLRKHPYFAKGTNVTLTQKQKDGTIKAVTFERGVDGFTQACGTGATAAAIYIYQKEKTKLVSISMPGGNLKIDLTNESPILIGQADAIGQVIIDTKE